MGEEETCRVCNSSNLQLAGVMKDYPYLRCDDCGFIYTPVITQSALRKKFQQGFHGSTTAPSKVWSKDIDLSATRTGTAAEGNAP